MEPSIDENGGSDNEVEEITKYVAERLVIGNSSRSNETHAASSMSRARTTRTNDIQAEHYGQATDVTLSPRQRQADDIQHYSAKGPYEEGHPNWNDNLVTTIEGLLTTSGDYSLEKIQERAYNNVNITFQYKTNTECECSSLLHFIVVNNNSKLLEKLLACPSSLSLTKNLDSQDNSVLHLAMYWGFIATMKVLLQNVKDDTLSDLLKTRNADGTNPIGMFLLHWSFNKIPMKIEYVTSTIIGNRNFQVNTYLNNAKGVDIFADHDLSSIGGLTCLHFVLKNKVINMLKGLLKRDDLNLEYPAMHPKYQNWHPRIFAKQYKDSSSIAKDVFICYQDKLDQQSDSDGSGDSEEEGSNADRYVKSLKTACEFINLYPTPHVSNSETKLSVLNSTSDKLAFVNKEDRREAAELASRVMIVHFHGVPFIRGQLKNEERRQVGKKFIDINITHMKPDPGIHTNTSNGKLKAIYSRTTTASNYIENLHELVNANEQQLAKLTDTTENLAESLELFANASSVIFQTIKNCPTLRQLRNQYGIEINRAGAKMLLDLWQAVKYPRDPNQKQNVFLFAIQKYINSFHSDDLMPFFWKIFGKNIDLNPTIIRYRYPIISTAKTPDHALKYGFGFNLEEALGERPTRPVYNKGMPKHRLAGFLYIVTTDLKDYVEMEKQSRLVDVLQYSGQIKVHSRKQYQCEVSFMGGVGERNVPLVLPLVYPSFNDRRKDLYVKELKLTETEWSNGKGLDCDFIEQLNRNNHQTKEFQLLMKMYMRLAIKLAQADAAKRNKILHYVDLNGRLCVYKDTLEDKQHIASTSTQETLKKQFKTPRSHSPMYWRSAIIA